MDRKSVQAPAPGPGPGLLSKIKSKQEEEKRRKLNYFGHPEDGTSTLLIRHTKIPTFSYFAEKPADSIYAKSPEPLKLEINRLLTVKGDQNLNRFLVVPERKNVWMGGIRSQCEGVLTAKTYRSADEDKGVYTVIPTVPGAKVTVEAVYKMWLALENAMIRRESLIIVEDAALAQVTKFRTEQWQLNSNLARWGSVLGIFNSYFFRTTPATYMLPSCLALYGVGMMAIMNKKDPASFYSECKVYKQYEVDPDSYVVCDAQISMKYLRSPMYRMFKLENFKARDKFNGLMVGLACTASVIAHWTNTYNLPLRDEVIYRGFPTPSLPTGQPLNIFEQLLNRFIHFGKSHGPGRGDSVHAFIHYFIFYFLVVRYTPKIIQTILEYTEREYMMETSIRYLQFRNLQGDERYEFPARNLFHTMQKDYPNNRILKEMHDHYFPPPEGYYDSAEFLETREPYKPSLKEIWRRVKISYWRNW